MKVKVQDIPELSRIFGWIPWENARGHKVRCRCKDGQIQVENLTVRDGNKYVYNLNGVYEVRKGWDLKNENDLLLVVGTEPGKLLKL